MKLKNRDVINYIINIVEVENLHYELPGRIGYTMKQNKKKLLEAYNPYKECLDELVEGESQDEYKEEVNELLNADVDVGIATTSAEPLFHLELDSNVFEFLDFMLCDE